jgi:beta-glucosidase
VNFAWGFSGVSPQLEKNYSVRWTGVLVPEETSDYLIGFTGQDGYRLWLDNKPLVEDWTRHRPSSTQTKPLRLEKGRAYPIRIEYFQTIRGAEARLVWTIPGRGEQKAVDAASNADLVVLALGLTARVEGEEMNVHAQGFSGGDRTSLDLPRPQEELLERVVAQAKPTILVLLNGSALAVNWANENVPAILEAWYPGGEGGTAVAEAIHGDFSPAGRLPVTFYKSAGQLPAFEDYSMAKRTYRYFDGQPLYPFGYGLSYTAFAYQNVKADRENVGAGYSLTITAEVTNTGAMAGEEVVELYLTHEGVEGAPLRALEGIKRIALGRGEHRAVSFTLRHRELSVVDPSGKRRIMPGKVDVWVGGGEPLVLPGIPKASGGETSFTITGEATLPD